MSCLKNQRASVSHSPFLRAEPPVGMHTCRSAWPQQPCTAMIWGRHSRFGNVVEEAPAACVLHHDAEMRVGQYAPAMQNQSTAQNVADLKPSWSTSLLIGNHVRVHENQGLSKTPAHLLKSMTCTPSNSA